jgi:hypothetical protein
MRVRQSGGFPGVAPLAGVVLLPAWPYRLPAFPAWARFGWVSRLDTDTALKEHPDLFQEYSATIIPAGDSKFAALDTAVWSGGSFIYVPKGVHVDIPLQACFRINTENMGQFERTLIIVYLMGEHARGKTLSAAFAGEGQHQDAGAKMVHCAPIAGELPMEYALELNRLIELQMQGAVGKARSSRGRKVTAETDPAPEVAASRAERGIVRPPERRDPPRSGQSAQLRCYLTRACHDSGPAEA